MKPIQLIIAQGHEHLTSQAGLGLVGALLGRTELGARIDQVPVVKRPLPGIRHGDVVTTMIGLLCLGKPDFDAVEQYREDPYSALALGLRRTPSAPTLRQRLEQVAGHVEDILREESAAMVARHAPAISPCYQVADQRYGPWVALDVDVCPFDNSDTNKEGVGCTYHRIDGYDPIFAYLGGEGYLVNCELRPGTQHSQAGALPLLRQAVKRARRITPEKLLVRLDAAHDDVESLRLLESLPKVDYVAKRNLRQESSAEWLKQAVALGEHTVPREGKEEWIGSTWRARGDEDRRVVFQVIRRTITAAGQRLLLPEVEVHTWWTSLLAPPAEVIELYHRHATSEQFHSELKTDMDVERLPSGKFAVNALVLRLGMVAYNALRLCGQTALRPGPGQPAPALPLARKQRQRRRLRSVILDLMYQAARLVRHARRWVQAFGRHNPWFGLWQRVYLRCCDA
jgi:hypothetical protein